MSLIAQFATYADRQLGEFVGRAWLDQSVRAFVSNPNAPPFLLVLGEPGVGKTAFAAHLWRRASVADAAHFCIAQRGGTLDPIAFSQSLSEQLSISISGFSEMLLREQGDLVSQSIEIRGSANVHEAAAGAHIVGVEVHIDGMPPETVFDLLVRRPLRLLYDEGRRLKPVVIVVDSLDEAITRISTPQIIHILSEAYDLPPQVRFILTSRPDAQVLARFNTGLRISIDAESDENRRDIETFLRSRAAGDELIRRALKEAQWSEDQLIVELGRAGEWNFLYTALALSDIAVGNLMLGQTKLPTGLDDLYRRLLTTRIGIHEWEEWGADLVEVLLAVQEPVSLKQMAQFLEWSEGQTHHRLESIRQILDPGLFSEDRFWRYHWSIADVLTNLSRSHEYRFDLRSGHDRIAGKPSRQVDRINDIYVNKYLVTHLLGADRGEEALRLVKDATWWTTQLLQDPSGNMLVQDLEQANGWLDYTVSEFLHDRHAIRPTAHHLPDMFVLTLAEATAASLSNAMPIEAIAGLAELGRVELALRCAQTVRDVGDLWGELRAAEYYGHQNHLLDFGKRVEAYRRIAIVCLGNKSTSSRYVKEALQQIVQGIQGKLLDQVASPTSATWKYSYGSFPMKGIDNALHLMVRTRLFELVDRMLDIFESTEHAELVTVLALRALVDADCIEQAEIVAERWPQAFETLDWLRSQSGWSVSRDEAMTAEVIAFAERLRAEPTEQRKEADLLALKEMAFEVIRPGEYDEMGNSGAGSVEMIGEIIRCLLSVPVPLAASEIMRFLGSCTWQFPDSEGRAIAVAVENLSGQLTQDELRRFLREAFQRVEQNGRDDYRVAAKARIVVAACRVGLEADAKRFLDDAWMDAWAHLAIPGIRDIDIKFASEALALATAKLGDSDLLTTSIPRFGAVLAIANARINDRLEKAVRESISSANEPLADTTGSLIAQAAESPEVTKEKLRTDIDELNSRDGLMTIGRHSGELSGIARQMAKLGDVDGLELVLAASEYNKLPRWVQWAGSWNFAREQVLETVACGLAQLGQRQRLGRLVDEPQSETELVHLVTGMAEGYIIRRDWSSALWLDDLSRQIHEPSDRARVRSRIADLLAQAGHNARAWAAAQDAFDQATAAGAGHDENFLFYMLSETVRCMTPLSREDKFQALRFIQSALQSARRLVRDEAFTIIAALIPLVREIGGRDLARETWENCQEFDQNWASLVQGIDTRGNQ